MDSLLVVGSANMDLVVRTPRFPGPGETVLGSDFRTFPGGKGANQAVAAGKLGAVTRFCGRVGKDAFGDELIKSLQDANVDTWAVVRDSGNPTGVAMITVDERGENTIVVSSGANMKLSEEDVTLAIKRWAPTCVLSQLESPIPVVTAAFRVAKGQGVKWTILNPAPAAQLSNDLLQLCDIIVPNEDEVERLTGLRPIGREGCLKVAQELQTNGVRHVIITLGSKGCFWSDGFEYLFFPARPVTAVDTTAAGDTFCGALAAQLSMGTAVRDAIPLATKAAAFSVTRPGAQASMPTLSELNNF